MDFLDESREIRKHGSKLPHWQQGEAMQFVTFRLGDAMPAEKVREWKGQSDAWSRTNPKPWAPDQEADYHRRFTRRLEHRLDEGFGSCLFENPEFREIMERVLMHSHGVHVDQHAWVIMPNHLHVLFSPRLPIETLMKVWKGVSARRIGRGSIWQKNYRDTLIRDAGHFANAVRYIRRNPAKLRPGTFTLWQGPRAMEVK